jgi:pyruvate kinase
MGDQFDDLFPRTLFQKGTYEGIILLLFRSSTFTTKNIHVFFKKKRKMNLELSRTKIIATIGPASIQKEVLKKMIIDGVDVCRLNFSHGKYEAHLEAIDVIRAVNMELGTNVAILADLQGPKLRVGEMENNGVLLEDGKPFDIVTIPCVGTSEKAFLTYERFPLDVAINDDILIDDGKIKLRVTETNRKDTVNTVVVNGGILSSKKGVNLPNTKVSLPSLTEKDKQDLEFALEHNVDWVALSFVRTATDIVEIKDFIKKRHKHALVVAKIEKPEAIVEMDNIIDVTDAVMIARGDLGVEVPFDIVPHLQKRIVEKCIAASKPVIIATQMMESMITAFRPTRAEANDVANAVVDGADCLMLSGETSVGKFPVDTIQSMQKIISYTERNTYNYNRDHAPREFSRTFISESICHSASRMANQSGAKAIITFSYSGYTAFRISSHRPESNIFVFTSNKELIAKLSLVWGVKAFYFNQYENIDNAVDYSIDFLVKEGYLENEDIVIHVASTPLYEKGRTNMLKLSYVKV